MQRLGLAGHKSASYSLLAQPVSKALHFVLESAVHNSTLNRILPLRTHSVSEISKACEFSGFNCTESQFCQKQAMADCGGGSCRGKGTREASR